MMKSEELWGSRGRRSCCCRVKSYGVVEAGVVVVE
jgi:hypothetical protein